MLAALVNRQVRVCYRGWSKSDSVRYHLPTKYTQKPNSLRSMATLKRKAEPLTGSAEDLKRPKKDATLTSFFGAPKAPAARKASNTAEPAPIKFDKEKWVASLNAEQKSLLKLEIDTLDPTWLAHLKEEITSIDFLNLKRFLQKEIDSGTKVFPPLEDVYSWSRHTPLNTVRVVILGQDPYHNNDQAHGMCFSVRPPTPPPPSLKNMFAALKKDYPSFTPPPKNGGLLIPWADQGVLLLNAVLTVRAHDANSHANHGWEKFTQKVIDTVVKVRTRGVVFLAWGSPAQKRCAKISGGKHIVLKSVHPSPLSAHKGFFDCGHFKKTNEWLAERYGPEAVIDWNLGVSKPLKAPLIDGPVKATADQKSAHVQGPTTELTTKSNGEPITEKDEFEDDEDAIEALEELARNGGDDLGLDATVTTKEEASKAIQGEESEK